MKVSEITTLKELRNVIRKNKNIARAKVKKSFYYRMNKKYKQLDWNKEYLYPHQIVPCLEGQFFRCWRKLKANKEIKPQYISKCLKKIAYKRYNIQGLFLLQQIAAQQEKKILAKKKKKRPWKPKYIPFFFDSAYLGRIQICSYPESRKWKSELLTQFLHKKEFLFDEDSPHYKGLKKTKRFVATSLMGGKVQKWEQHLQRFLLQD